MRFALGGLILLVLCCVLGWFAGVPWIKDKMKEGIGNAIATEISTVAPGAPASGELRFSLNSLENAMERGRESSGTTTQLKGFALSADGDAIVARASAEGEDLEFRFVPRVTEDGQLAFDSTSNNDAFWTNIIGPEFIGDSVSGGVNTYLDGKNLKLTGVSIEGNDLVLEVAPR